VLGGWVAFSAVNVVLMWLGPGLETIPFHLVWVSLSAAYGLQAWPLSWALSACFGAAVFTAIPLTSHAFDGVIALEEIAEIPLMSALFLVLVWHVRRRTAAVEEASRSAERESVAVRMQQRLVRLASHELRTPLTVARGYTELLRDDCTDPKLAEDATIVLDELGKLERIAGRLLALAWAHEADGADVVDIEALAHRATKRWAPVANQPMRSQLAPANATGHEDRLETAVDCLVENAITHTGNLAAIVLRTYRLDGWAVLEVEDDGPGMTAAAAPADAKHGLGLTIVRGVVDAHGGQLLFGQGGHGGLCVTIRLPAAPH
jgi:signal transduction histidine kinase